MNRTIIKGQRCTNTIRCVGAVGCDLSMFTQHIIAAISVMIQTFIQFGADVSKQGPQISADQHTQTHCDDVSIHGAISVMI